MRIPREDDTKGTGAARAKKTQGLFIGFLERLRTFRVLDPASGSGNFLYVTLEHLKRLEGEVLSQLDALGETLRGLHTANQRIGRGPGGGRGGGGGWGGFVDIPTARCSSSTWCPTETTDATCLAA